MASVIEFALILLAIVLTVAGAVASRRRRAETRREIAALRRGVAEMADRHEGFDMSRVSVSAADTEAGSPKVGDKIARNPKNHDDRWLVAAAYFADNFEPLDSTIESANRVRAVYLAEIEAVLMHGRDYLALMTPENRALLVEALDNLEAVTR